MDSSRKTRSMSKPNNNNNNIIAGQDKVFSITPNNYGNWDLHLSKSSLDMKMDLPKSVEESLQYFNNGSHALSISEEETVKKFNQSLKEFCQGLASSAIDKLFRQLEPLNTRSTRLLSIAEIVPLIRPTIREMFDSKLSGPSYPAPPQGRKGVKRKFEQPETPLQQKEFLWIQVLGDGNDGKTEKLHLSANDSFCFNVNAIITEKVVDVVVRDLCFQSRDSVNCSMRKCLSIPATQLEKLLANFNDQELIASFAASLVSNVTLSKIDAIVLPLFLLDDGNAERLFVVGIADLHLQQISVFCGHDCDDSLNEGNVSIHIALEKCWALMQVLTGENWSGKTVSTKRFEGLSTEAETKISNLSNNEKRFLSLAYLEMFCGFPGTNLKCLAVFRNFVKNVSFSPHQEFVQIGNENEGICIAALRERYFRCLHAHRCFEKPTKVCNFWHHKQE